MAGIVSAPAEGIVVERDMPKGYVWAKVCRCWTVDPASATFFPPRATDFGDDVPAAYFTAVVAYDPELGYHERDIKFIGVEAEALYFALTISEQVALLSTQGHLHTREIENPDGTVSARTVVMVKPGTTKLFEFVDNETGPSAHCLEQLANMAVRARNLERKEAASIEDAAMDVSIWPPKGESEDCEDCDRGDIEPMDECPF